jgi:hypothetical protein
MTQAYNLSQLANNLNTSGQLDATDGLVNAVPIANGGTGASNQATARSNLDVPSTSGSGATGNWPIKSNGIQTTNFTVEESGGKLIFKYGATTIASMNSSGVFTALSNVVGGGTP